MIPISYQFFILFAFACVSIATTIMYSLEKDDSIKQGADHKKYTKNFLIIMIVFWCLLGVAFIAFVWKNKRAYFRLRGTDKEIPAVIPFKFQMILVGLCFIVAIVMTIVDMAVEKKCLDDKEECHTNNYLITLIVFWGLFLYFSILFFIIHYDWIIPGIKGYFKFARGQKRFRAAKARTRQKIADRREQLRRKMSDRGLDGLQESASRHLQLVKKGSRIAAGGIRGLGKNALEGATLGASKLRDRLLPPAE